MYYCTYICVIVHVKRSTGHTHTHTTSEHTTAEQTTHTNTASNGTTTLNCSCERTGDPWMLHVCHRPRECCIYVHIHTHIYTIYVYKYVCINVHIYVSLFM